MILQLPTVPGIPPDGYGNRSAGLTIGSGWPGSSRCCGWHGGGKLVPPEGVRLVFQPPSSPELQPAERLWPLAREAVANENFATLADFDRALAARRLALAGQPDLVKDHTRFHWWPEAA